MNAYPKFFKLNPLVILVSSIVCMPNAEADLNKNNDAFLSPLLLSDKTSANSINNYLNVKNNSFTPLSSSYSSSYLRANQLLHFNNDNGDALVYFFNDDASNLQTDTSTGEITSNIDTALPFYNGVLATAPNGAAEINFKSYVGNITNKVNGLTPFGALTAQGTKATIYLFGEGTLTANSGIGLYATHYWQDRNNIEAYSTHSEIQVEGIYTNPYYITTNALNGSALRLDTMGSASVNIENTVLTTYKNQSHGVYVHYNGPTSTLSNTKSNLILRDTISTQGVESHGIYMNNATPLTDHYAYVLYYDGTLHTKGVKSYGVYSDLVFKNQTGTSDQDKSSIYIGLANNESSNTKVITEGSRAHAIYVKSSAADDNSNIVQPHNDQVFISEGYIATHGALANAIYMNNSLGGNMQFHSLANTTIETKGTYSNGINLTSTNFGISSINNNSNITTKGDIAHGIMVAANSSQQNDTDLIYISHGDTSSTLGTAKIVTNGPSASGIYVTDETESSPAQQNQFNATIVNNDTINAQSKENDTSSAILVTSQGYINKLNLTNNGFLNSVSGNTIDVSGVKNINLQNSGIILGRIHLNGSGSVTIQNNDTLSMEQFFYNNDGTKSKQDVTNTITSSDANNPSIFNNSQNGIINFSDDMYDGTANNASIDVNQFIAEQGSKIQLNKASDVKANNPNNTLTLTGDYYSQGGQLYLTTYLEEYNEGESKDGISDRLIINGNVIADTNKNQSNRASQGNSLPTQVYATASKNSTGGNLGINGIKLIQVNGDRSDDSAFKLSNKILVGKYEYILSKGKIESTKNNWYLDNYMLNPDHKPDSGSNTGGNGGNTGSGSNTGGNGGNTGSGGNTGGNGDNTGSGGNTGGNGDNTGSGGNTGGNGGNTGSGGNTGGNGGNTGSGSNTGGNGGNTGSGSNTGGNGGNTGSGGNTSGNGGNTGSGGNTGGNGGNTGSGGNTGGNGDNTGSGSNTGGNGGNTGSGSNTGGNGGNTDSGGNTGGNGDNSGSGSNTGGNGGNNNQDGHNHDHLKPGDIILLMNSSMANYLANLKASVTLQQQQLSDRLISLVNQKDDDNHFLWLRTSYDKNRYNTLEGYSHLKGHSYKIQLGGDLAYFESELGYLHVGVMGGFATNQHKNVTKLTNLKTKGSVHGYQLGLYATYFENKDINKGLYVDVWSQLGRYKNRVYGEGLLKDEKYYASVLSTAIETGYGLNLLENEDYSWFLKPQVQFTYNYYHDNSHIDDNGLEIDKGEANGIISRLGVRFYGITRDPKLSLLEPFIEANWLYDSAKNRMKFAGKDKYSDGPQKKIKGSVGATITLKNNLSLLLQLNAEYGRYDYKNYGGNFEANYRF